MKRRDFLKNSLVVGAGISIGQSAFAIEKNSTLRKSKKLVILHTNDTHSNIDAFPINHPKYPSMGGVVNRYKLIQKIRSQHEHVLLLDSGDIFQGTPYFNKYKGVLEMKLMSKMGYDASTLGNHDFDIGIDGFCAASKFANFPFLNTNYDFSNSELHNKILPYYLFNKAGIKIGVFGVGVELKGLVAENNWKGIQVNDAIEKANATAKSLKKKGCDLIICLSHLGYKYDSDKVSDLHLATLSNYIDIILGGHTHTFLENPTSKKGCTGQQVMINQVGWAGLFLGRIDIEIKTGMINHSVELIA